MKPHFFYCIILVLTACRTIEVDPPAPEFKGLEEISSTEPSFLLIQTEMALKPYLKEADQNLLVNQNNVKESVIRIILKGTLFYSNLKKKRLKQQSTVRLTCACLIAPHAMSCLERNAAQFHGYTLLAVLMNLKEKYIFLIRVK